jgi:hypothetical protein
VREASCDGQTTDASTDHRDIEGARVSSLMTHHVAIALSRQVKAPARFNLKDRKTK